MSIDEAKIRRAAGAVGLGLALGVLSPLARADNSAGGAAIVAPAPTGPASSPVPPPAVPEPSAASPLSPVEATSPHTPARVAASGVAVVALAGASEAAWPFAGSVYATSSLRPVEIDDRRARVLCGEAPPADAPAELRDLGQMVAAVTGEDAPSRALLEDIARRFGVRAVLVVRIEGDSPRARVFLPDARAFDAATYGPDEGAAPWKWSGATRSLARAFGSVPPDVSPPPASEAVHGLVAPVVPVLASHEVPKDEGAHHTQFYESGWFWGALGAAAFAGAAIFLATRDSSPSMIHLQIEVPH